ncbi:hypothetical protein [Streptacidiphilus albus]|uniref:hypothetical protein n=1 Tax=Streptacidiphilus albus TaxID=105425 RepID=UPI00128D135D|nr:hypothetical protein [Streptacidiphilus albus]
MVLALSALLLAMALGSARAVADPAPPPPPAAAPAALPAAGGGVVDPVDPVVAPRPVPAPAPGSSPTPTPRPTVPKPRPAPPPGGGLAPPADPAPTGGPSIFDIPGQIKAAFASLLASLLQPMALPLMNLLVRFLLSTPDVTGLPRVVDLWDSLRVLACSLYGLFVLAAGVLAMGHGTVQQRWAVRDLLPRLVLGMLAANLSLFVCGQFIALSNAVSTAVFGNAITADDLAGTLVGLLTNLNTTTAPLYLLVFTGVVLISGWLLVVTLLVRTAVLTVLVVAAPLLLACHASPATDGAARLWWRAFTGAMAVQIVQSVVFLTCVKVLLDPANYSLLGLPTQAGLINLMVLGCTIYILLKVPGLISRLVTAPVRQSVGGGGGGGGMHLLRKVALGAIGLPMGPYAFGAQLAGRAGMRGGLVKGLGAGRGRPGGRPPAGGGRRGGRPPGGGKPKSPAGPAVGPTVPPPSRRLRLTGPNRPRLRAAAPPPRPAPGGRPSPTPRAAPRITGPNRPRLRAATPPPRPAPGSRPTPAPPRASPRITGPNRPRLRAAAPPPPSVPPIAPSRALRVTGPNRPNLRAAAPPTRPAPTPSGRTSPPLPPAAPRAAGPPPPPVRRTGPPAARAAQLGTPLPGPPSLNRPNRKRHR